ncbi:hypothetical protein [Limnoglobus roseus]|uniref:Uncharacterized protein n=1 Tax=Limnoglobus roseus TaxID=2598579 RepID=A0A5C1AJZ1_9BACT|nr:hypothetical protein [Limnoglobus roseus]QEL18995.1 hypothetical protein PX52LOC_06045 [Limnoglobus roseus]
MTSPRGENWEDIDVRILACDILGALLLICTAFGVGLTEAKGIHIERYRYLRSERSTDFACLDEQYWAGVYG